MQIKHLKDGHVYCRQCGEQIDSEPLACLGSKKIIFGRRCKCDREEEAKRKDEEMANHIRRLKEECFNTSRNLISCTLDKVIEPERQEVIEAICREKEIDFVGKIPYDKKAVEAVNKRLTVVDIDCQAGKSIKKVFDKTMNLFLKNKENE